MDVIQLYQDFSINYLTEGHKHCRPGFVNTPCPFCTGHAGYHLSYNLNEDYFVCWRCGWHPVGKTISALLNIPPKQTEEIIKIYGAVLKFREKKEKVKIEFQLPSGVMDLRPKDKKYLESRGFDPDRLEHLWKLKSTGPVSILTTAEGKKIDYKNRILIPFYWNQQLVSFDTRSQVKEIHGSRYKACPESREWIDHKKILYGIQEKWGKVGICVEGPTDVWRFGPRAFATSGIKYTYDQIKLMALIFKRIFIVYDDDPQALVQARLLKKELIFRGVDAIIHPIKGDPGGMPQDDANHLVKQLISTPF